MEDDLRAALLLGAATGMRSFAGIATLSARGRLPLEPPLRTALTVGALGELVADKLPFTPARTAKLPYLGRVAIGALCGGIVAGPSGAVAAALSSGVATEVAYQKRRLLTTRGGIPDLPVALLEDVLAYATAYGGTRAAG